MQPASNGDARGELVLGRGELGESLHCPLGALHEARQQGLLVPGAGAACESDEVEGHGRAEGQRTPLARAPREARPRERLPRSAPDRDHPPRDEELLESLRQGRLGLEGLSHAGVFEEELRHGQTAGQAVHEGRQELDDRARSPAARVGEVEPPAAGSREGTEGDEDLGSAVRIPGAPRRAEQVADPLEDDPVGGGIEQRRQGTERARDAPVPEATRTDRAHEGQVEALEAEGQQLPRVVGAVELLVEPVLPRPARHDRGADPALGGDVRRTMTGLAAPRPGRARVARSAEQGA